MSLQLTGTNHQGSTLLALTGGTATAINYSPSGATRARSGALSSLPGFNGERADPFSAVTHLGNGYRAYSPALQRFTCPDSESPFSVGGINPYAYCEGDPVNLSDPSGHGPVTWLIRKAVTIGIRLGLRSAAAESMSASLAALSGVETGLEVAATAATGIASKATEKTNPQASQRLKWASVGMGAVMGVYGAGKAGARIAKGIKGIAVKYPRLTDQYGVPVIQLGTYSGYINPLDKDAFFFTDSYKLKSTGEEHLRLNIIGHGGVTKNGEGTIAVGDKIVSGKDIKNMISDKIDISKFEYVRVIACHSAEGKNPLAQQLADAFGLETKGYHGTVTAKPIIDFYAKVKSENEEFELSVASRKMHETSWVVKEGNVIIKGFFRNSTQPVNYKPVKFKHR